MSDRIPFETADVVPAFWTRVGDTFKLAFSNPGAFFDRVPNDPRLSAPWRLMLLFSVPLYALLLVYVLLFGGIGTVAALGSTAKDRWVGLFLAAGFGGFALLAPLLQGLAMLLVGLAHHAALALWGGLRQSAGPRATIRATGYVQAFMVLAAFIPMLNLLSPIAGMLLLGWGLARVHRTDTWRSIAAAVTVFLTAGLLLVAGTVGLILLLVRGEVPPHHDAPPPSVVAPTPSPRT